MPTQREIEQWEDARQREIEVGALCEGCDERTATTEYEALFEVEVGFVLVRYCDDCARAARGEFEGAPCCGEPVLEIRRARR